MKKTIIIVVITSIITSMIIICGMYIIENKELNANKENIETFQEEITEKNEIVQNDVQVNNEVAKEDTKNEIVQENTQMKNEVIQENEKESNDTLQESDNKTQDTDMSQEEQEPVKEYIEGYEVVGYMEIPEIQLDIPVLKSVTLSTLEISVGVAYGNLNQVGNTVIMGHANTGKAFENVHKLEVGDIIYVTDANKQEITYEVYDKQVVNSNDASFFNRQTNGSRELTLQTGNTTDTRLIILAKEKSDS